MLYDYRCPSCGAEQDNIVNRISERRTNAPVCCGGPMDIVIKVAPYGYVDNMEEYRCPVTNQGVTSRYQRNEIMKREGLIDANDFLKTDEQRAAIQAKHDADKVKYSNYGPEVVRKAAMEFAQGGQP